MSESAPQHSAPVRILNPGVTVRELASSDHGGDVMQFGGGLEGAQRTSRETVLWSPSRGSPDAIINTVKTMADARGRDSVQNDGYGMNAVAIHRDGIVGNQFKLNSNPDYTFLGVPEGYGDELQKAVESRFGLAADSMDCWFDAAGMNTFTGLVRLAVGGFCMTGEVLASAEWLRATARPFKTAIQMISPDRLCNPGDMGDTATLRRGVTRDPQGRPVSYSIRQGYVTDFYGSGTFTWNTVNARTPWGRKQMLHIIEQLLPDQSRGVADMVSVLKQMRMTRNFQEVTLQNAVVNASYAAAIESDLPPEVIAQSMGAQGAGYDAAIASFLQTVNAYVGAGRNISMDGVRIPHLLPGTKLNLKPVGTPGGVGTDFEASLLRHVAAGLGVSYEELAKDYSKVSYSSARTSIANTGKFMASRKKAVADRFANDIFTLWFEEQWNAGNLPRPTGKATGWLYESLVKEALTRCTWIGAGAGQIDELKETQAAVLKLSAGLSTREIELSRLGVDWREITAQQAREAKELARYGLDFSLNAKRPLGGDPPVAASADDGGLPAIGTKQPPKKKQQMELAA